MTFAVMVALVGQPNAASAAPMVDIQPSDQSGCEGADVEYSLTATAGNGTLVYQWWALDLDASVWVSLTDGGIYTGTATAKLTVTIAPGVSYPAYLCHIQDDDGPATGVNSAPKTLVVLSGVICCGDGVVQVLEGEECDDGNAIDDDGCSICLTDICGDSIVNNDGAETCDDGNAIDADGCTACIWDVCGDGTVNDSGAEECDDGNADDDDGCTACVIDVCGDGVVNDAGAEECDDGNADDADGCTACVIDVCGDGSLNNDGIEECDDGNVDDADGCSAACVVEEGWECPTPGDVCVDIDECATDVAGCGLNAVCENADPPVRFTCTCDVGYVGDGFVCESDYVPPPPPPPSPPPSSGGGPVVIDDDVDDVGQGDEDDDDKAPDPAPIPRNRTDIAGADGMATVGTGSVGAHVEGVDEGALVSIEIDSASGATTLTVAAPAFWFTLTNPKDGTLVDIVFGADGPVVTVKDPGGKETVLELNALPVGALVSFGIDVAGNTVIAVVDPSGDVVDVTIESRGNRAVYTITYNAPSAATNKVIAGFPGFAGGETLGGSVTIEATGLVPGRAITLLLGYHDADLAGIDEAALQVGRRDDETGRFDVAGTRYVGPRKPTGTMGDYGVDTGANTAWAEVATLGTFAVGIPALGDTNTGVLPPSDPTPESPVPSGGETTAPSVRGLCGAMGMITMPLTFATMLGLRRLSRRRCR